MKITVFDTEFTSSKFAKSPFGDKTFEFRNIEVSIEESLEYLRNDFVLNRNYSFDGVKRLRRTKKDLEEYLSKTLEFIIIDFDRVNSRYSQNKILDFFKENDFYVGIIPSRSWNGVDTFNMKGIIKASGFNNKASVSYILKEINKHLYEYCKIDFTSINEAAYQAPSFSEGVLLLQKGKYIPKAEVIEEEKPYEAFGVEIDVDDDIVKICVEEYSKRGFTPVNFVEERGLISFSHPNEKTNNGYFMFLNYPFILHHFNKEKSFNILNSIKDKTPVQKYLEERTKKERETEFSGTGYYDKCISMNKKYIEVGDREETLIQEWLENDGLFKLKSAMGTGKSNIIDKVIQISREKELKVILITNRISVAKDFKSKYDIKMYSDGNYEIGDDLIVQYDSLWRYSLKHFDVVVLDEFVSIMLHSRSSKSDYGNLNKVKLMYAMRTKRTMIADAFLFGIEDRLIPTKPKYAIINDYREEASIYEYRSTEEIAYSILHTSLEERKTGNKVTVSCAAKNVAQAIKSLCEENGLKTIILTAETTEEEKEDIYKIFESETHDRWDTLIFTPTLTVGVSILNKSNHHFHIDESTSVDVVSSIQMIRRNRKASNIHYFIKERKKHLETSIENLNDEVNSNIEKFYKKSNSSLLIDIDDYGDFKLSKLGEFVNEVEIIHNKLENDHKHSFELLLKHQFKNEKKLVKCKIIDISSIKKENKIKEEQELVSVLNGLKEIEYSESVLEDFSNRNYISSRKETVQKLMSEIKSTLKPKVNKDTLKELTELEITSGFKYIQKLKKLKFFLTSDVNKIENLISFLISENPTENSQIQYFRYLLKLKKNKIRLKDKITTLESKEVDSKIGWGDFSSFLRKIGYKKRGGAHYLSKKTLVHSKLIS